MGVEEAGVEGDARSHDMRVGFGRAVEHGNDMVFEFVVERGDLGRRFVAYDLGIVTDGPAGDALDAALDPPAVQHAQAWNTVQGRFHAARPGSLLRTLGRIQPEIDAGSDDLCQRHVVVLKVYDLDVVVQSGGGLNHALDQGFAA